LVRAPALRTDQARTATRLELFFDLAYVLVVAELATSLLHDATWAGLGQFAGLFIAIWFSWVGFTLYANRFDTDDVILRVVKLLATLAIAGCAASAAEATGSLCWAFASCFLAGRLLLLGLYARAWRHVREARTTIGIYLTVIAASAALWAVSLATEGTARYVLWGVAVAVDALGAVIVTVNRHDVPLHMEHLPERFGLLVILVLGEAVSGTVTAVQEQKWAVDTVWSAAVGFVIAAGMWWNYFDVGADAGIEHLQEAQDESDGHNGPPGEGDVRVDERHDLFAYGHLPLALGVVTAGVGIEELALRPHEPLPSAGGWLLAAGLAAFFAGLAAISAGTARSWRSAWPWPAAWIPAGLALGFIPHRASTTLLVATVFVLFVAVHGTRVRRRA